MRRPIPDCTNDPTGGLPVQVLRLVFSGAAPLPPANIWRSAFGPALRDAVCVTGQPNCAGCLLGAQCAWPRMYQPITDPAKDVPPFGVSRTPPVPYALLRVDAPKPALELRLFGAWSVSQAPLLIAQFARGARKGLGRSRATWVHETTQRLDAELGWTRWNPSSDDGPTTLPAPVPCPASVGIELLSPLRLQRNQQILGPQQLDARSFALAVLRRLQLLVWAHGETPPPTPPLDALDRLELHAARLTLRHGERYSARQRRAHPLDGIAGTFTLGGEGLQALWPWLWAAQWTGVGKGTAQGLGAYRLTDTASLPHAAPGAPSS